jgi:hypothetical protein
MKRCTTLKNKVEKNMKNILLKVSQVVFASVVLLFSCNQTKKSNFKSAKNEIVENNFKLNKVADTIKFETIYNDGRITAVRNVKYYGYLVRDSKPFGDTKFGLSTVITEWNKYDANVACPQAGFIQVPRNSQDIVKLREELREGGADPNIDLNSTMVGGDEETNRRIKEPCKRYWAVASKIFEKEFKNLKKADGISNRDTTYVTFDFITTSGFYTVQVQKSELESGQSIWSNLFKESKFLNTEMARVQNESQKDAEKRYEAEQLKKIK